MGKTKLKACPFCGAPAAIADGPIPAVACTQCRARTADWSGDEYAAEAWNQRKPPNLTACPKCQSLRLQTFGHMAWLVTECRDCGHQWDEPC